MFPGKRRAGRVTEVTPIKPRTAGAVDLERIYAEWLARMPESLRREAPLPEAELRHCLQCALRVLEDPSLQALSQVEAATRAIARPVSANSTVEVLLRCFRDELARLLFRHVPPDRRVPTSLTQLASRVGDAVWSTHTETLQATISRQRDERFEQELMLVKSIQQRLLPRGVPSIPGFDVAGRV